MNEKPVDEFGDPYQQQLEQAQSSWWVESMHELSRRLLGPLSRDTRVLDIGCGSGASLRWISAQVNESFGVDISREGLAIAHQTSPLSQLAVASAAQIPFPDRSMTVVVSTDVLQHLTTENRQEAFREMFRVLGPGGRALVRTNAKSLRRGVEEREDWQLLEPSVLRAEAESCGLRCTRITHANAVGALVSAARDRLSFVRRGAKASHHSPPEVEHHGLGIPARRSVLVERLGAAVAATERFVIVRLRRNVPLGHTLYLVAERPQEPAGQRT